MITKLPDNIAKRFPEYREKWIRVGLSTERVKRADVEGALTKTFAAVGKPRPRYVVMLKSPLEVAVAIALLRSKSENLPVRDSVLASVRDSVRDSVSASVLDSVLDSVSASVLDSVSDSVSDSVRASVSDSVLDSVRASVRDIVEWRWWYGFGQFEAPWLSFYDVMKELGVDTSKLDGLEELCRVAGWSVLFWDFAFVSDRPALIHRDDRGRLHREDGPAVAYPDGFKIYAVHGVRLPEDVIETPASITVERIERETNAEVRRVMIERYGLSKYLVDSGAQEAASDDYGVLYRKEIPGDEPLVMVKVVNSTAEPNGVFKDYFLRVPPTMATAREAVAWTFGKTAEDYAPAIQT